MLSVFLTIVFGILCSNLPTLILQLYHTLLLCSRYAQIAIPVTVIIKQLCHNVIENVGAEPSLSTNKNLRNCSWKLHYPISALTENLLFRFFLSVI